MDGLTSVRGERNRHVGEGGLDHSTVVHLLTGIKRSVLRTARHYRNTTQISPQLAQVFWVRRDEDSPNRTTEASEWVYSKVYVVLWNP